MAARLGAIGNHLFDIKRGRFHQRSSDAGAAGAEAAEPPGEVRPATPAKNSEGEGDDGDKEKNLLGVDYVAIDALLARSEAAIEPGEAARAR